MEMANLHTSKATLSPGGRFFLVLLHKCTVDTKQSIRLSYIGSQLKQQFPGYRKGCVRTIVDELAQLGFVERQGQSGLASVMFTNAGLAAVRPKHTEKITASKVKRKSTHVSAEASMLLKILRQNTGLLGGAILLSKLGILVQKRFPAFKAKGGTMKALVQELVEHGMAKLELLSDNLTQQLRVLDVDTAPQHSTNAVEKLVCAHFLQTGKCRYGSRCRYRHCDPVPKRINKTAKPQSLGSVSPEASALLCALRKFTTPPHSDGVLLSKLAPHVFKLFPGYKANGGTMKALVQELLDNALVRRQLMPNRVSVKLSLVPPSSGHDGQRKVLRMPSSKGSIPVKRIPKNSGKPVLSGGAQCLLQLLANHAMNGVHVARLSKIGAELKEEFSQYNKGCLRTLVDELVDMGLAQRQGHSGLASVMLKQKAFGFVQPRQHAAKVTVPNRSLDERAMGRFVSGARRAY